jgi:signal transduction histidine kinase
VPRSLQARLISTHIAVLCVALALFLLFGGVAIRRYENRTAVDTIRDLAVPITLEINSFFRRETPLSSAARTIVEQAIDRQASEMGVRIFLLDDSATVMFDSDPGQGLINLTFPSYQSSVDSLFAGRKTTTAGGVNRIIPPGAGDIASPMLDGQFVVLAAVGASQPNVVVGIAAEPVRAPLLRRLVPSLLIAAGGALLIAIAAAVVISRRVAAPISRLTEASVEMSNGHLAQAVPGEGDDEIGRLVRSFNAMSRQVAQIEASQRDFLAAAAHDLRTPLTTIAGYTQAMRDGLITDPAARERTLETIAGESERMSRLIRDLLDLARLQSGQLALHRQPIEVQEMLTAAIERFRAQADEKRIQLTVSAQPVTMSLDHDRVARVLDNLLANALRHTPSGGSVLLAVLRSNGDAEVLVEDSGPGIPPELLPRLFERYARGDDGPDRHGLGLAVASEIITAHGGTLSAENRAEGGARFRIRIPQYPGV